MIHGRGDRLERLVSHRYGSAGARMSSIPCVERIAVILGTVESAMEKNEGKLVEFS